MFTLVHRCRSYLVISKVKGRIVSILDVSVKNKIHCRDLIVLACDTESEFDVVIEKPPPSFVMSEGRCKSLRTTRFEISTTSGSEETNNDEKK